MDALKKALENGLNCGLLITELDEALPCSGPARGLTYEVKNPLDE